MQVGLLVDSACDLPYDFIKENDIFILPITVHLDGETIVDDHDPERVRAIYRSGLLNRGHAAETEPYTTEQIHQLLLEKVVTHYDFAFLETVAASRSNIFANATEAMNRTMADYRPYRREAGREGAFSMRVVDSGTIFAAQGVLAAHTIHLIKQGIPKQELRQRVGEFTKYIYGALVPRDVYYLRQRARARGDKSVSGMAAFLSKTLNINPVIWAQGANSQAVAKARSFDGAVEQMLNYATARVRKGLLTPYVVVTAEPELADKGVEHIPGGEALKQACEDEGVELMMASSGITSSIYVGPGTIGVALAAEPHEFSTE